MTEESIISEIDDIAELFKTALISGQKTEAAHFGELLDCLHKSLISIEKTGTVDSLLIDKKTLLEEKSTRFTRPKKRVDVSQSKPVIGYAKPIQQHKNSHKYRCMVSGESRTSPCGGCSNPKGCLSGSMQYKEKF
jgi:hypothetical protein